MGRGIAAAPRPPFPRTALPRAGGWRGGQARSPDRVAGSAGRREIDAFAAELIDRFSPLPPEVENLLELIAIKPYYREAGIEKLEAGPKGAVVSLRDNRFANPAGLTENESSDFSLL